MGMMDIQMAFIKFDINSLLGKLNKYTIEEKAQILTLPHYHGSDPNIQTIIRFDIKLPANCDYITNLAVFIYFSSIIYLVLSFRLQAHGLISAGTWRL